MKMYMLQLVWVTQFDWGRSACFMSPGCGTSSCPSGRAFDCISPMLVNANLVNVTMPKPNPNPYPKPNPKP